MIYCTLGNLHPEFRSSQDAIHLLAIAKSTVVRLAELGGFKESMSANRPCRTCFTDANEWKTNFNEKKFTLRDAATHRNHVEVVTEPNVTERIINIWKKRYGVNGPPFRWHT